MCQIDQKIYVRADGHRSVFHDTRQCVDGRRRGKTCSDAKIRTTEYHDPTSPPIPSSPLTPNGPSYQTRTRRPSTSSRPSTRDGPIKSLKPEIHIEIGTKKGKGKTYPTVTLTTGKTHRSSTGSTYTYESPGSEGSHRVRTGYPEVPAPPLNENYGGLHSRPRQYLNPSSDESFISPTYHSSDAYDTPSLATGTTATSSGNRPVIHHAPRHVPSPVDTTRTTRGQAGTPPSPYRTTEFTPRGVYHETTGGEDRERRRVEARKKQQQEALDSEVAANLMREENDKHLRFKTDHFKHRAEQRAESVFAAYEQRRAEDRERIRQQERKEREAQAAKEAAAKRSKPSSSKPKSSRKTSVSMSAAEAAKQRQLLAADARQMERERINADALDREEWLMQQQQLPQTQPSRQSSLQEWQQDPRYYDPRDARPTVPSSQPPMIRRPSQSGQTRPNLSRAPSTRSSGATQIREDRRQPPVSYYNGSARTDLPSARERRPSSSSGNGPANLFVRPATNDPRGVRNMGQALPNARGPQVGHNFPQPQQASHRLNQAFYQGEFETDSENDLYSDGKRR